MKPVRVAILGNRDDSFVRPMGEGLERMVARAGGEPVLLPDGLEGLRRLGEQNIRTELRRLIRDVPSERRFLNRVRDCNVIVVVDSTPRPFLRGVWQIEELRRLLPDKPIVLYDRFYLPTRGSWPRWIRDGNAAKGLAPGGFGLERFDWYLCASVVSETGFPAEPQPCSLIGVDLDDLTLWPGRKREFRALIDFEHAPDAEERAVQIRACEQTGTPYTALQGQYRIDEIREIYRRTSLYFLAKRESFGLPICELQACGSYVFTPYSSWTPSHGLKTDFGLSGPGQLSPNFIVYGNDPERLKKEIERIREAHDPQRVFETFLRFHPQLFRGDVPQLAAFLRQIASGEIHSERHLEHPALRRPPDASELPESGEAPALAGAPEEVPGGDRA
ncbi:MAG: hypothetical protein LC780_03675 [Acidobacteria bacterium]|nr:hypothetical protein [Acidobacteriota bacterium]